MAKASDKNHKNTSNSADKISSNGKRKRTRKTIPRESPQPRSSTYRGVTRHRWTGRYEAHLWDKNCWNESQSKKGRQVYLGAYDNEEAAAHAYDLAALKYWGEETLLNFPLTTYEIELKEMEGLSKEEYIGSLRRKSSGFSRGVSKYRGVARHHHNGRWEARIGRVFGNKYLYLGTYATQEEAATAYDMAAIEYRGLNAVTNFDLSRYIKWLRPNQSNTDHPQPNPNPNPDPTSNPNPDIGFSFLHLLTQSSTSAEMADPAHPKPGNNTSAPSALGILLQSSKFKEMLEQTTSLDNPSSPSEQDAPRRSFPDDIQTSFEFHETSSFTEEHDIIFGDLNSSFASQMLHCELDA